MDMSGSIEHAVSNYFSQWLAQHPYLAWSIAHPLPSLGLGLLAIFLLWGLIKAIGRGMEQIWLFLLKTPFKLLQPILSRIWGSIWRILGQNSYSASQLTQKTGSSPDPEQIARIIDRLQLLSQEQNILLQELLKSIEPTLLHTGNPLMSGTQSADLSAKILKFNQKQP